MEDEGKEREYHAADAPGLLLLNWELASLEVNSVLMQTLVY